jgi:post-segregation antitoxin (ccd killing protein)
MIRTQISLTEDQMKRLRAEARRRRLPVAALVREAVERGLATRSEDRRAQFRRALSAVGGFRSEAGDSSAGHDELAGESRW